MAPRSELTPAVRERICELSAVGWSYRSIHKRYPWVSISGIRYTIKKERERLDGVTKPRSGRPKKLDETDRERLFAAVRNNPNIKRGELLAIVSHKVSYGSIRRLLKAEDATEIREKATSAQPKDQPKQTNTSDQEAETLTREYSME